MDSTQPAWDLRDGRVEYRISQEKDSEIVVKWIPPGVDDAVIGEDEQNRPVVGFVQGGRTVQSTVTFDADCTRDHAWTVCKVFKDAIRRRSGGKS